MSRKSKPSMLHVIAFKDLETEEQKFAGGKGGTLARLYQKGYPVPDGYVILPSAFDGDKLLPDAWNQVQTHLLRHLKKSASVSFAVRSSALSEDSAQASFAGEFETVLDVCTDEEIREAIHTVRKSRLSERVQAYSKAKGMDFTHEIAVVVQQLVRADLSGVLFTADPVTGNRVRMTGNFVYGLGERLVSGEANALEFSFNRPKGRYEGPPDLKKVANRLYKLGDRLEKDLGCPQDIEWAVIGNKLYLLQSRPVTTFTEYDPRTGEWNSTFRGDYLWSNLITGEVFPTALTPSSWSIWEIIFNNLFSFGDVSTLGNIAYRPYLNYSLMYSFLMKLLRKRERVLNLIGDSIGVPPAGIDLPLTPVSLKTVFFKLIPREIKHNSIKKRLRKELPEFLSSISDRCQNLRQQIKQTQKDELISLWLKDIKPLFFDIQLLQDSLNETLHGLNRNLEKFLRKFLKEEEVNTLLTSLSSRSGELASIGQLAGLSKLTRGELSDEEYLRQYGHRGSYENYLSVPRPYEDPTWLDKQLEEFNKSPVDVTKLLEKRTSEFDAIWEEFKQKMKPKQEKAIKRSIDAISKTCLEREEVRSSLTRFIGVIRDWFLRASNLTGLGEDIFFLTIDEVIAVMSGDDSSTAYIPARRETHARYAAIPSLPTWIRGRFDPIQWANDPNRRSDFFDSYTRVSISEGSVDTIKGVPGSAGRVEGLVRRIDRPEEGNQLRPGEILVTGSTNVGWTPLFPRAAAVITDVGASLSHAAIVARELGVPAVVGCKIATMCLKTGDRVSVDGSQGIVKILDSS